MRPLSPPVDTDLHTKGMIQNGGYWYIKDLLSLNAYQDSKGSEYTAFSGTMKVPPEELTVEVSAWKEELSSHPDQQYVNFIISGLEEGFRIGFNCCHDLLSASSNLHIHNPTVVSEYLAREVALNRM